MQKKRVRVNNILDKLHRGVVYTCIGVTLYGTFLLGMRVHRYLTVVRPQRQAEQLKMIEEEGLDKAKTITT
ncbi:uncharacterized protein LOC126760350 [Bactrocera neohumeralis]|uniref:Uncharacterized protein LOC105232046 n=1 Tax=Bactrocera dorsalis TaxID=27457 RepID=A0A6I9W4U1_BACDO|nr:uncharacterized protein LOC105232046 [Bactrocera dorsalis]XP_039959982.1 uncharacterized protein LOC120774420 [Bactrocera tryoni]XP_050331889.1 uncharacterized protein LOC126760350 [Bactrocera neohumeralis]